MLCAAVCDGAGSATASHEGARRLADQVVDSLARRATEHSGLVDLAVDDLRDEMIAIVGGVRGDMQSCADRAGRSLSDYATTLVGALATDRGGCLFHIGDGVAVAHGDTGRSPDVISLPENGEYANETYFVTGADWQSHLRLSPIVEPVTTVVLMSDGAAPFAMQRSLTGLFRPFMDPVSQYLGGVTSTAGNDALRNLLDDPRTDAITQDDKTLLIAQWQA